VVISILTGIHSISFLKVSDRSGSRIFYPGWVNFLLLGWVGSGQPSLVWVWKISSKNTTIFNFFPSNKKSKSNWVKGGSASYLLRVKSMLGSGQGPSLFKVKLVEGAGVLSCDFQILMSSLSLILSSNQNKEANKMKQIVSKSYQKQLSLAKFFIRNGA